MDKFIQCLETPCCSNFNQNYDEPIQFFASLNIPFQVIHGESSGWRTRSKLAVRGTALHPLIGLFYEGTHDVYEIPNCIAHHPKINEALHYIKKEKLHPYNEKHHTGLIRYLQLVVERKTGRVQASFVLAADIPFDLFFQSLLKNSPPDFFHSLFVNVNPFASNTIFGPVWKRYFGPEFLQEEILSIPVCYLPGSFGQANPSLFEKLLQDLITHIPSHKKIVEFYAGVGVIGIALAKNASHVTLSEINPESKLCFDEMLKYLTPDLSAKLTYRLESAESAIHFLDDADVYVVDPPRKGLDKTLLRALMNVKSPKTCAYISCGFSSLKRDLNVLLESGWIITHAAGYALFPGTPHLETLVILKNTRNPN